MAGAAILSARPASVLSHLGTPPQRSEAPGKELHHKKKKKTTKITPKAKTIKFHEYKVRLKCPAEVVSSRLYLCMKLKLVHVVFSVDLWLEIGCFLRRFVDILRLRMPRMA